VVVVEIVGQPCRRCAVSREAHQLMLPMRRCGSGR
jgi:hypothetical protein